MAAALRSVVGGSAVRFLATNHRIVWTMSGVKFLSTSGKKTDTPVATEHPMTAPPKRYGLFDEESTKAKTENRDWISYGFSLRSEAEDRFAMNLVGFMGITFLLVGGAFILAYQPDLSASDWTRREAFLELHRREKLGRPLISKDYIDPSKFNLPSEDEIGDMEIII